MQKSIAALFALSLLSTHFSAHAESVSNAEKVLVNSSEFQYDKAFTSPNRSPLLDKQQFVAQQQTTTANWEAKNQALQLLSPAQKQRSNTETINNNDFWIFDSWATLSNDFDYDGYYSTVTVEFDADTIYNRAYVYAIIYLGTNDVFDSIHVTSVFAIDSDSSNDSFIVESELLSGFPSNDYEIMIELYDADNDQFVAFSDGLDDADLSFVPLESSNYEITPEPTVVVVEEHGGSLGILAMIALGFASIRRATR